MSNAATGSATPSSMPRRREAIARQTLNWVLFGTLLNLLFNVCSAFGGQGHPLNSFLWSPLDNFGDFFSLLHSYPGGGVAVVHDRAGLHAILPAHPMSLTVVSDPPVTNLHMMPLSTVISLGLLALMRWVDPVALFVVAFAGLVAGWSATALRFAASRREAMLWVATAVISYPMLMTIARGNLFAGLTALLLAPALLMGIARRAPAGSAALLALACNFRPNAILFAVPLLVFYWPHRWRFGAALAATGIAALAVSMATSTSLYPAYTPAAIRTGLANYYTLYVSEGWGLSYGSSLFGAARLVFGLHHGLEGAALAVSLAILAGGAAARVAGRIDDAVLVFLSATSYCLGSTVLGDYHLLAFLAVPMALAATAGAGATPVAARMRHLALGASCLVLMPKNYLFFGSPDRPLSFQVLANPLLLLGAAALVLALAWRGESAPRRVLATA